MLTSATAPLELLVRDGVLQRGVYNQERKLAFLYLVTQPCSKFKANDCSKSSVIILLFLLLLLF